jgi:hypothetical protein
VDDAAIVEALQLDLGVTRPELEHVMQCPQCSVTDDGYDAGPYFCAAFRDEFRPLPPQPPPTPEQVALTQQIVAIWEPLIRKLGQLYPGR